jgi:hypothetical protein
MPHPGFLSRLNSEPGQDFTRPSYHILSVRNLVTDIVVVPLSLPGCAPYPEGKGANDIEKRSGWVPFLFMY